MKTIFAASLVGFLLWAGLVSGQQTGEVLLGGLDLYESPELDAQIWSRERLTREWSGGLARFAESGLTTTFNTTYVLQGVAAGGFEGPLFPTFSNESTTGNTFGGDLQMKLDTGKAGWWEGGVLKTRMQARSGRSILDRAGTIAAVNNEAVYPIVPGSIDGSAAAITELSYEQSVGETVSVFGGLLNTSMGDVNAINGSAQSHSHFLNIAMLYSLVEDATVPHASLGGGINLKPTDNVSGSCSIFGSAETAGHNPFNLWHGTTFSTEWTFGHTLANRPGAQTLGLLYGINERRTDIAADPRLVLISILAGVPVPTTTADTWAVYYNAHQYLQGDAEGGWGLFTRLGFSDGNPNFVRWNFAGGVGGIGLLPGRKNDGWGLGVFYLGMSNEDLLRGLGVRDELGSECFYNIALSPVFHVSLDAQVMNSALPHVDTTWILGMRTHLDF
jgi:porin